MKGSLPDVWARILRASRFVVPPLPTLKIKLQQDVELRTGESVCAKLAAGPLVFPDAWVVQTDDRDDQQVVLRGAEGFERRLLWDHEIRLSEAGPRCIVEYRVALPKRRSILPMGIGVHHVFERRHSSLCAMTRQAIVEDATAQPLLSSPLGAGQPS